MIKEQRKKLKCIQFVVFNLILILLLSTLNYVFTPYKSRFKQFEELEEDSIDVLVVGTSHMFTAFDPAIFWKEYGISSYLFPSNAQPMAISYLNVKEAFKTQIPKIVVFDVFSLLQLEDYEGFAVNEIYAQEGFYRTPYSFTRLEIAYDTLSVKNLIKLYFPLYQTHNSWVELTKENFCGPYSSSANYNGPLEKNPDIYAKKPNPVEGSVAPGAINMKYLEMLLKLCQKEGVEPIALLTPCAYRENISADNWLERDNYLKEYFFENNISYYNYNDMSDIIQFDYTADLADYDHVTKSGAEKFCKHFGSILIDNHGISGKSDNMDKYIYWQNMVDTGLGL